MKTMKNFNLKFLNQNQNAYFILFVLFLIGFLFRFFSADYFKTIVIYKDELLYYQLAENLIKGQFLHIYNLPTNFQKILYSVFLSPAFLFENRITQQHILSFLTVFSATMCVFPIFYFAKKILHSNQSALFVVFVSLFLPDLTYSMTFMSESLFLTLSLFLFVLFWQSLNQNHLNILQHLFLGMLCYGVYLLKEIALVLPMSYAFVAIFFGKGRIHILKNLAALFFSFCCCFILMKKTLFLNLSSSYDIDLFSFSFHQINLFFYGIVYYWMQVCVASLFFPLLLPFFYWEKLSKPIQNAFLLLLFCILASSLIISYSITIREDVNLLIPRAHLRYIPYAWIILWTIFYSILKMPFSQKAWGMFVPFLLCLYFYPGMNSDGFVDQTILAYLHFNLSDTFYSFYQNIILGFKIVFFVFVGVVFYFFKKSNQESCFLFFAALILLQIYNNHQVMNAFHSFNHLNVKQQKEIFQLEKFIQNHSHENFVLLTEFDYRLAKRSADSFLNYPNLLNVNANYVLNLKKENQYNQENNQKPLPVYRAAFPIMWGKPFVEFYEEKPIHYVMIPKQLPVQIENVEELKQWDNEIYRVFKNKNPNSFPNMKLDVNLLMQYRTFIKIHPH